MCASVKVCAVAARVRRNLRRMAKTDDEDGKQQPESTMAAKAGGSSQLEFRVTGRQPIATYLAHPL